MAITACASEYVGIIYCDGVYCMVVQPYDVVEPVSVLLYKYLEK